MYFKIMEQRLNLAGNPTVPYRFFLTDSYSIHHNGSGKNYRQIIKQKGTRRW